MPGVSQTPAYVPPALPSQCAGSWKAGSGIGKAVDAFNTANTACVQSLSSCVHAGVNASCGSFTCDATLNNLADTCVNGGGTFCIEGGSGIFPKFTYDTALCLPAACSAHHIGGVEAHFAGEVCGQDAVESGGCKFTLDCSFGITTGEILGIVGGFVALLLLIVLGCWVVRRRAAAGGQALNASFLGESTEELPAEGTYAVLPEDTTVPAGDGKLLVGNDAVLESQSFGL